jgi:hypothetical protein
MIETYERGFSILARAPPELGVCAGSAVVIRANRVALERAYALLVLGATRTTSVADRLHARRMLEHATRGRVLLLAAPCALRVVVSRLAHRLFRFQS